MLEVSKVTVTGQDWVRLPSGMWPVTVTSVDNLAMAECTLAHEACATNRCSAIVFQSCSGQLVSGAPRLCHVHATPVCYPGNSSQTATAD